jgi:hypothetical protein
MNAQVPSYVPTNGLVAYYPFNGNANDVSVNANNGINNGATLTTDRFGNVDSAYFFNGSTEYINVPSSNTLNFQTNNSFTLSYWINATSINTSKVNVIINKQIGAGTSSQDGWNSNVEFNRASNLRIQNAPSTVFCDPSSNAGAISNLTNYHITQVFQNGTSSIYINGIQVSTSAGCLGIIGDNSSNMFIGKPTWTSGNAQGFNGIIDDIGIWNRALTQQEITSLYTGIPYYSDTCNNVSGSLTQGLVGYWPFCGNANDDSGNGNNGTVNGATLTTDRFGNTNSAYSFNGTSNFIEVPDNNLLDVSNNFTISLWMKISDYAVALSSDPQSTVLSKPKPGFSTGYCISAYYNLNNNKFSFNGVINSTQIYQTSNSAPPLNTWINVIYTYDGASSKLYKNGVLESSSNVVYSLLNSTSSLFFGKEFDNASTSKRYFKGLIDDIGIWNRALTTQEVTQLFNQNQCFTNTTVTDTLVINVGQLSYTNPISYANNITIFPNPASTQVNIAFNNISDLNGGSIKIINSIGQQVATTPITTSGTNTTMTLSTWGGSGLYFVQIVNPQGQIVDIKKIILQ